MCCNLFCTYFTSGAQENHARVERKMEEECKELKRSLSKTSDLLQHQVNKNKMHVSGTNFYS